MQCVLAFPIPRHCAVPCVAPYLALCYVLLSLTHCVVQVACTCCHRAYKPDRISAHQQLCQKWQQMQHEDPPEDSQSAPHSVKRAPPTTSSPAEMAQCRCCHKSFKKSMLRHHERACRFHKDRAAPRDSKSDSNTQELGEADDGTETGGWSAAAVRQKVDPFASRPKMAM